MSFGTRQERLEHGLGLPCPTCGDRDAHRVIDDMLRETKP